MTNIELVGGGAGSPRVWLQNRHRVSLETQFTAASGVVYGCIHRSAERAGAADELPGVAYCGRKGRNESEAGPNVSSSFQAACSFRNLVPLMLCGMGYMITKGSRGPQEAIYCRVRIYR